MTEHKGELFVMDRIVACTLNLPLEICVLRTHELTECRLD